MYDPDCYALTVLQSGQELSAADTVAVLSRLAQHAPDIAFCGQVEAHVADVATRLYDAAVTSTDARISAAAGEIILAQNAQLSQHGAHVDERLRTLADYVRRNVQSSLEGFNAHMQEQHNNVTAVLEARLGAMTAEAGARDASRALETRSLIARQEALMHGALAQSSTAVLTTADASAQARSDATAAHLRAELLEERASSEARIAQAAAQAESRAIGVATRLYGTTEESRRATLNSARDAAARLREAVEALRLRTDALEEASSVTADEVANAAQLAAAARQSASQASKEHTLLANRLQRESKKLQDLLETKLDALAATDAALQLQLTASRHAGEELERRVNDLRRSLDRRDNSPPPVNDEVERALLRLSQRLDAAERAAAERDAFADQLEARLRATAEQLSATRNEVVAKLANVEKMILAKLHQIETDRNVVAADKNPQRRKSVKKTDLGKPHATKEHEQPPSSESECSTNDDGASSAEEDGPEFGLPDDSPLEDGHRGFALGTVPNVDEWDELHATHRWAWNSATEIRNLVQCLRDKTRLPKFIKADRRSLDRDIETLQARTANMTGRNVDSRDFIDVGRLIWAARAAYEEAMGHVLRRFMLEAWDSWTAKHRGRIPSSAVFMEYRLKSPKPKPERMAKPYSKKAPKNGPDKE